MVECSAFNRISKSSSPKLENISEDKANRCKNQGMKGVVVKHYLLHLTAIALMNFQQLWFAAQV